MKPSHGLYMLLLSVIFGGVGFAQTVKVTFLANSATVPDTLWPDKAVVQMRGDTAPLTWDGATGVTMTNVGGDYWMAEVTFPANATINYKFFTNASSAAGDQANKGWENDILPGGNRVLTTGTTDMVVPLQFINGSKDKQTQFWKPWNVGADSIAIWVRVNMQGWEAFNPATDMVGVRGAAYPGYLGNLSWAHTLYLTKEDQHGNTGSRNYNADNFYSGVVKIPRDSVTVGQNIEFKFVIMADANGDLDPKKWEDGNNHVVPIPAAKADTTLHWIWFNNTRPAPFVGSDTMTITYNVDVTKAIQNRGFATGDTIIVQTGWNGTGRDLNDVSPTRTILTKVGFTNTYTATEHIIGKLGAPLYYQYYVVKDGQDVRETFYNFDYTGSDNTLAERRILTPSQLTFTVNDNVNSNTDMHRMPVFRNISVLARAVKVTWTCDVRPAIFQVMKGDTLFDIQGTDNITDPASILTKGVWMNGPATSGWTTWGQTLRDDAPKKMYDDGTHGDAVANDSIFTVQILYAPDSTGSKRYVGQEYKFGIYGGDNEGGKGGFGNNHYENIDDSQSEVTIASQFGSINPTYYKAWDFNNQKRKLFEDPATIPVLNAAGPITLDGKLDEPEWSDPNVQYLLFGPNAPSTSKALSVTGGVLVKTDNPYTDTTWTMVRFVRKGTELYVGFSSNDKQVCKFGDSWEGDGIFMKVRNTSGVDKEFKLYFNNPTRGAGANFEPTDANSGAGVMVPGSQTITMDSTNVDNGYTAEMQIHLDKLGYTAATTSIPVLVNIFDPDNYNQGDAAWAQHGVYYKSWWGSEWGPDMRTLTLTPEPKTTVNVTFVVNTATVPDTLWPDKAFVQMRGDTPPLTWDQNSPVIFQNIGGDYWKASVDFPMDSTINYKIFTNAVNATGDNANKGWENDIYPNGNRMLTTGTTDMVVPVQFVNGSAEKQFANWQPWSIGSDSIAVWVRVNMQGWQGFNPATNTVGIRGAAYPGYLGNLSWAHTLFLTKEAQHGNGGSRQYNADYFYSGVVKIPRDSVTERQSIEYKFVIMPGTDPDVDPLKWEDISNRSFPIPFGKADTTLFWQWFNNTRPVPFVGSDTLTISYKVDLTKAIQNRGFQTGDSISVQTGWNGTGRTLDGASPSKTFLTKQGFTNTYVGTETIIAQLGQPLYYQYYVTKDGQDIRETFYNFDFTGSDNSLAERRIVVPASKVFEIDDIQDSRTSMNRMPVFRNIQVLSRYVTVYWEVDMRPPWYQVQKGDTLFDIQGPDNIFMTGGVNPVYTDGVWINGPATGGYTTWGQTLRDDTPKIMYDDATHGDLVAGDHIYTATFLYGPDSTGSKRYVGQEFKFGCKGGDNEGGRGGFGNNHYENIDDSQAEVRIRSQFGSINPKYYNAWDFNAQQPADVEQISALPGSYRLDQNYPNPFNPSTTITYTLARAGHVMLRVYDMFGREVATLADMRMAAGTYRATFDARALESGMYVYELTVDGFRQSRKMTLLK